MGDIFLMNKLDVLYEDNHVIVVVKPCNILSQADITGDSDMLTLIKGYLKEKYQKPGNVYLGLVHRLDRPVGGIMVFAKTSKAAARLSKQVQKHELEKQYYAIICGKMKNKKGEFCDCLKKQANGNTVVVDPNVPEGKEAKLTYQVVEEKDHYSLVRIQLLTGRHHQIRVQFSSRGYPLLGDRRYGGDISPQLALFSYHLAFYHPISKQKLVFEQNPRGEIWQLFFSKSN